MSRSRKVNDSFVLGIVVLFVLMAILAFEEAMLPVEPDELDLRARAEHDAK